MLRLFLAIVSIIACTGHVSADPNRQYMDTVLKQAGIYLQQLGLDPARAPAMHTINSGSLQAEISNVQIRGLGSLTAKKCKLEKPKLECDVSLKNLDMLAHGRMKDGSTPFQDVTVTFSIKEGELEVEVNSASKVVKVKFDDKLRLEKLRFSPTVTSNSKALDALSKQLEDKLAGSVSDFISKEYFNVVKNAVVHVPSPNFRR